MRHVIGGLALALVVSAPAASADLFSINGTVRDVVNNQQTSTNFALGFDKAKDVINFLGTSQFSAAVPQYRPDISQLAGTIAFRGVPITLAFPQGSARLSFAIPSINETRTFTGAGGDRDDALDQLQDYLLENSGDFLRRFQRELIRSSANDPTAGNPNSLQSSMIANDFAFGGFDTSGTAAADGSATDNKIFLGVSAGTFKAQGVTGKTVSAPLSYTVRFDSDPRYQLQFALPLTYIDQSGARTGAAGFGVGFQVPLLPIGAKNQWYLTPRATIGGTGSVDAGAASILGNLSLTSRFVLDAESAGSFTIANMVGYNWSVPFHVSDVHGDYRIRNLAFKNGVQWELPVAAKASLKASYAYTRFTGTDLYMEQYHDVSLSIGTWNTSGVKRLLRVSVDGTFGRNFKRAALGFGYTF